MDAGPPEDDLERISALLARLLAVPTARVAPADGSDDLPDSVVLREAPLILENARDGDAALPAHVGAYAGWPLRLDGAVVGSLCALDTAPRAWSAADLTLLEELAGLAERLLALRNGARAERERHSQQSARRDEVDALSKRLQLALLPRHHDDTRVHTAYEPGSDRLLLGGDFADVRTVGDGTLEFVIGDVSGHGPEAAALASALRASWGVLRRQGVALDALLEALDRVVVAERAEEDLYATVLVGTLDAGGRLRMASAGHPPPIVAGRPAREAEAVTGIILGAGLGGGWPVTEIETGGNAILLYTDGLIEGRAAAHVTERFGLNRLLAALDARGEVDDEALGPHLITVATAANGAPLPDDVTTLLIEP